MSFSLSLISLRHRQIRLIAAVQIMSAPLIRKAVSRAGEDHPGAAETIHAEMADRLTAQLLHRADSRPDLHLQDRESVHLSLRKWQTATA